MKIFRKILNITGTIIIVLLSLMIISNLVTSSNQIGFLGFKTMTVESNSMYSIFQKGDIIVIKKVNVDDLEINDIISYTNYLPYTDGSYQEEIVTHYYSGLDGLNYQTRPENITLGDTAHYDTPRDEFGNVTITSEDRIVGKYWFKIPKVGYVIQFFRSILFDPIMLGLVLVNVIIIYIAVQLLFKKKAQPN